MLSWDNVSIGTAEKIWKAADKHEHPIARRAAMYAAVMDAEYDKLIDMTLEEFESYTKEYRFIDTMPTKSLSKEWEGYDLVSDVRNATAAQLIDIESSAKDGNNDMARVMALLWRDPRPLTEKEPYVRDNMPITVAKGVYDFFLSRSEKLQIRSLRYLKLKMMTSLLQLKAQMVFHRYFGGLFGSKGSRKRVI